MILCASVPFVRLLNELNNYISHEFSSNSITRPIEEKLSALNRQYIIDPILGYLELNPGQTGYRFGSVIIIGGLEAAAAGKAISSFNQMPPKFSVKSSINALDLAGTELSVKQSIKKINNYPPRNKVQERLGGYYEGLSLEEKQLQMKAEDALFAHEFGINRSINALDLARVEKVHKNSHQYVGKTHVYRIIDSDGKTYKIGESTQGVRKKDGASIRAEQQARKLHEQTGERYETEVRRTFSTKKEAYEYETKLIKKFREVQGKDTLPGNKGDH
jgi:hypothetical protein